MESNREALCGPKGRHLGERRAWRGGSAPSRVTLGGRQLEMPRLRVRSAESEMGLARFQWAAATDPMDAHTMETVVVGVSTRNSPRSMETLPGGLAEHATSSNAVSRRFLALPSRRMHEFLARRLDELDIRVVFIDAKVFREHCMLIALGLDSHGRKHVLGLREGATENAQVASDLLSDLVERGLPSERTMLFIIDGAKALRRTIADVYGELAVVQRCQVHKRANVLGHLLQSMHASVARALRDARHCESTSLAERQLRRPAHSLDRDHRGAAASVREGLEDTLSVLRLGLTGPLQRTLRTTNPIENLNGAVENYTRNLKLWRGGRMIQRWVSAVLLEAEKHFRRMRGYRDMRHLIRALDALSPHLSEQSKVA